MRPAAAGAAAALLLATAACTANTAPGNDREAELEPPPAPAEVASVGAATQGVATALLFPQTLTDPDLASLPDALPCRFHYTRVGLPVVAYGSTAVLKLNGKLVPLPSTGDGRWAEGPVTLQVRPLEEDPGTGEPYSAELVFRVASAPDELGYHGFARCRADAR